MGLEKNPTLIPDPITWSDNDFKIMENTLQHCLPLIRFYSLSSEEFIQQVHPYKKLLNPQFYEDLLNSYLNPNSEPSDSILLPRYRNLDGIIDTKIVNLNIVSIISRWIDNKVDKFSYLRGLYLPYKFKLLLRGSQDGFTPKKFHELCDNISCTVIFIKVKETEEILGGYNPMVWKSSCEVGKTKDSFIFSFKSKNNFKDPIYSHVNNTDRALFYSPYYGPSFGRNDLLICNEHGYVSVNYNWNHCKLADYEKKIRDTKEKFSIEDYEVFQILKNKC